MTVDKQLWLSARNIADSEVNLTHLWDTLFALTLEKNLKVEVNSTVEGKFDWIESTPEIYFNVKKSRSQGKGAPKRFGSLTVCVQLTCDRASNGPIWKFGDVSKVLIGYSPENDDHWEFTMSDPDSSGHCDDAASKKYYWEYEESEDGSDSAYGDDKPWIYAVPLSKLDGMGNVKRLISEPVSSMISGEKPGDVLKKISKDLCIPPKK